MWTSKRLVFPVLVLLFFLLGELSSIYSYWPWSEAESLYEGFGVMDSDPHDVEQWPRTIAIVGKFGTSSFQIRGDEMAASFLAATNVVPKTMTCLQWCRSVDQSDQSVQFDAVLFIKYGCNCKTQPWVKATTRSNCMIAMHDQVDYMKYGTKGVDAVIWNEEESTRDRDSRGGVSITIPHHVSNPGVVTSEEQVRTPVQFVGFHASGRYPDKDLELKHAVEAHLKSTGRADISFVSFTMDGWKPSEDSQKRIYEELRSLDVIFVWEQDMRDVCLKYKPAQRFTNALSVGRPVIVSTKYHSYRNLTETIRYPWTSEDFPALLAHLDTLIAEPDARARTRKLGLEVAQNHSITAIRKKYTDFFVALREQKCPETA